MKTLEVWIEFGSTYSHVAVQRIEPLAEAAGVSLRYRPFLLGPLFKNVGWNDSPFNIYPDKGAYMWRDMERLCRKHGIPFQRPSRFPRNGLLAARVALAGEDQAWQVPFIRGVFMANFALDREIAEPECIAEVLREAGADDPQHWLTRAGEHDIKTRLRNDTERARARGVFGAPSFFAGDELFWGQDRIEDALSWP